MNLLVDAWCAFSPRIRVACWMGWMAALGVIGALSLLSLMTVEGDMLAQQRAANRQLWQRLLHIAGPVSEPRVVSASPIQPFSALLPGVSDVQLLHWQPSAQGGELAVKAHWPAIPQLFGSLASQGISVDAFSLKAENAQLILTLRLEYLHEE